jgi:hypothetical protein
MGTRVLSVFGGLLVILAGWRGRTHSEDTPRYTAGYGSGLSPGSRRFFGGVAFVIGVVIVFSAVAGIPREFFS